MGEIVLEMKNITKRFPGVVALDSVSLQACRGKTLALLGENGAGKSTLMKILSGLYSFGSYEGELLINNKKVSFSNTTQSEKSGIAMIYQELNMHNHLSVAENLYLGNWKKSKLGFIDWNALNREAVQYIKLVGLDINPAAPLRSLNPSQQQLIAIARALANNPQILVLDEPTASLSEEESQNLYRILRGLKERGITCLLISHKLDEVFAHSDELVVMRDGKVVGKHTTGEISVDDVVAEMIGRELSSYYPKVQVPLGDVFFEVERLAVPYPYNQSKNIVEDVNFSVRRGEIFGICGLVGSGRSELVNAIFGKLPITNGSIKMDGKPLSNRHPMQAIANGVGLVTEDRKADGIVGLMSIRQNLTLSNLKMLTSLGVFRGKLEQERCQYYLETLRIKAPSMEVLAQNLSGGNQQKVVIGRCLMAGPRLLILDEPTRGIDVGAKNEIYKIMCSLAQEGMSIIMISSEMPELLSMCDNMLILANGKSLGVVPAGRYSEDEIMKMVTGAQQPDLGVA